MLRAPLVRACGKHKGTKAARRAKVRRVLSSLDDTELLDFVQKNALDLEAPLAGFPWSVHLANGKIVAEGRDVREAVRNCMRKWRRR